MKWIISNDYKLIPTGWPDLFDEAALEAFISTIDITDQVSADNPQSRFDGLLIVSDDGGFVLFDVLYYIDYINGKL